MIFVQTRSSSDAEGTAWAWPWCRWEPASTQAGMGLKGADEKGEKMGWVRSVQLV